MTSTPATLEEVARAADIQIMWCQQNGAPFTAQVLQAIRENLTSRRITGRSDDALARQSAR